MAHETQQQCILMVRQYIPSEANTFILVEAIHGQKYKL